MTTNAMLGHGTVFAIASESSPDTYVALEEVRSVTPPSQTLDQIDVTHMQSPNRYREFISGLIDPGECSLEMTWIPGSTSDDRIRELINLPSTGASRARNMQISAPNGVTETFSGEITGYEKNMPVDDALTATVTVKVSGQPTVGST